VIPETSALCASFMMDWPLRAVAAPIVARLDRVRAAAIGSAHDECQRIETSVSA
jgi:hypothetical protein